MQEPDILLWKNFAQDDIVDAVRRVTIDNKSKFVNTTVSTNEPGYRKSKVLWHYEWTGLFETFTNRIRHVMPLIEKKFPILPQNYDLELQLTASGNGDYFKRHQDNGTIDTDRRVLTYVYYFGLTDNPNFFGGKLVIETPIGNVSIEPKHNSLVIFPSGFWHEVMPVTVPSNQWEDNRMTLNGWVRKQPGMV